MVRQNTRGTPLAQGEAGMTPAHAGMTPANAGVTPAAGVNEPNELLDPRTGRPRFGKVKSAGLTPAARQKKGIVRQGTRGTPLMQNIGTAGMTPMNYGETDSLEEYDLIDETPSDAVTRPKVAKEFVKNMMKGITLKVMMPGAGGFMRDVEVFLDDQLSALTVALDGNKRRILLEQIDDISDGQDEIDGLLSSRIGDNCATLFLEDGQVLTFHFDDFDERDTFVKCLSMVIVKQ